MGYSIAGTMVTGCECTGALCPCNVDELPNTPTEQCQGVIVCGVTEGNLDQLDLSGVDFALVYTIPGKPSGGSWRAGLVVDEGAPDEQAQALERIIQGKEGGLWGDFAPLIAEWFETKRAAVSVSDGKAPSGSIAGVGELTFRPFQDAEGNPTRVKNAIFGMGPEFTIGQASGAVDAFGISFDASYGDTHRYEWAS